MSLSCFTSDFKSACLTLSSRRASAFIHSCSSAASTASLFSTSSLPSVSLWCLWPKSTSVKYWLGRSIVCGCSLKNETLYFKFVHTLTVWSSVPCTIRVFYRDLLSKEYSPIINLWVKSCEIALLVSSYLFGTPVYRVSGVRTGNTTRETIFVSSLFF